MLHIYRILEVCEKGEESLMYCFNLAIKKDGATNIAYILKRASSKLFCRSSEEFAFMVKYT